VGTAAQREHQHLERDGSNIRHEDHRQGPAWKDRAAGGGKVAEEEEDVPEEYGDDDDVELPGL
jgi:hypothetical protein